jgi:hypothetical protein
MRGIYKLVVNGIGSLITRHSKYNSTVGALTPFPVPVGAGSTKMK